MNKNNFNLRLVQIFGIFFLLCTLNSPAIAADQPPECPKGLLLFGTDTHSLVGLSLTAPARWTMPDSFALDTSFRQSDTKSYVLAAGKLQPPPEAVPPGFYFILMGSGDFGWKDAVFQNKKLRVVLYCSRSTPEAKGCSVRLDICVKELASHKTTAALR